MSRDKWLNLESAVDFIIQRRRVSVGAARELLRQSLHSRTVRARAPTTGALGQAAGSPKLPISPDHLEHAAISWDWDGFNAMLRFAQVEVFDAEVEQHDLLHYVATEIEVATEATPRPIAKNKGGRPTIYDWAEFTREAMRRAILDGFNSRQEMTASMIKWADEHWDPRPDDRLIRRKLAEIYPHDVP